jgi:DNA-binding GntR family transcriptional regulator
MTKPAKKSATKPAAKPTAKPARSGIRKAVRKAPVALAPKKGRAVQTGEGASETRAASLGERAYRRLREMILDREVEAGALLNELRVAERLEMSRTPVREALLRLTGEGLLVRADARSFAVRTVSAREFFESMRVREVLEAQAVDLGIQRITFAEIEALEERIRALEVGEHNEVEHRELDDLLHRTIAEASGNAVLVQMISMMRLNARLFRVTSHLHRQQENHLEHLAILAALKSRNNVEARNAMVSHIRGLQDDVIKAITG